MDIDKINRIILDEYPNEAVICLEGDKIIHFTNIADDPEHHFKVDSKEFYKHEIDTLIHSHTYRYGETIPTPDGSWLDPRTPSKDDMKLQMALDIPFIIIATDGDECSEPLEFPDLDAPLLGIQYVNGAYDCWSLIRRFHKQEMGVTIPDYPREYGWWLKNYEGDERNIYMDNYLDKGFEDVSIDDLQYGDLLMFTLKGVVSHGGVYVGDDKFIHHLNNRLSITESLPRWRSRVAKVARYDGVNR